MTATIALFVALGGTSYAVVKLPAGSVGSREVKDRSLRAVDLSPGTLPSALRGPRGPEGPRGADGAAGARGPSDVITAVRNSVSMSTTGPTSVDVVTLNNVPAGDWWVLGSTSAVYEGAGVSGSAYFRCSLVFGTVDGTARAAARVGLDALAAAAANLTVHEGRTLSGASSIRLRCGHDETLPGGLPRLDHAQLTAIRTDSLQIQPG